MKKRRMSRKARVAISKAQKSRWAKKRLIRDAVNHSATTGAGQGVTATVYIPSIPPNPKVDHPEHYGGDTTYEVIKVLEAWELGCFSHTSGFNLGNAVKYIARSGKKDEYVVDLKKASFYLIREIENQTKVGGHK